MMSEMVIAAAEAAQDMLAGASAKLGSSYRKKVRANAKRLSRGRLEETLRPTYKAQIKGKAAAVPTSRRSGRENLPEPSFVTTSTGRAAS